MNTGGPDYDTGDWTSTLEPELEYVDPTQLLAHPANARRHPGAQRDALRTSLNKVGWIAPVIVNRTTSRMLDGHARAEEAISKGATVPVAYVTIPEEDEAFVLATFDPITLLATFDEEALTDLIAEVDGTGVDELDALLNDLAGIDDVLDDDDPVGAAAPDPAGELVTCPNCRTRFDPHPTIDNGEQP